MDIDAYLDRIDYHGSIEPTAETLRGLHLAHLLAVPFENLNIGMGWPIVLDEAALFEKIVARRRGGFCYELNSLFAALLRELGFDVTLLSAGVARSGGGFGPDFDHMTLLVTTDHRTGTIYRAATTDHRRTENHEPRTIQPDGQSAICNLQSAIAWLADVGFGDSFREPLHFDEPGEQWQGQQCYRIARAGDYHILERREAGQPGTGEANAAAAWEPQYRLTLHPRRRAQFLGMCRYHQTSPESSFTRRRVCTRATPNGRVTLSDMRLIITHGGERRERLLADEAEVRGVLREHFGIDLDRMTR